MRSRSLTIAPSMVKDLEQAGPAVLVPVRVRSRAVLVLYDVLLVGGCSRQRQRSCADRASDVPDPGPVQGPSSSLLVLLALRARPARALASTTTGRPGGSSSSKRDRGRRPTRIVAQRIRVVWSLRVPRAATNGEKPARTRNGPGRTSAPRWATKNRPAVVAGWPLRNPARAERRRPRRATVAVGVAPALNCFATSSWASRRLLVRVAERREQAVRFPRCRNDCRFRQGQPPVALYRAGGRPCSNACPVHSVPTGPVRRPHRRSRRLRRAAGLRGPNSARPDPVERLQVGRLPADPDPVEPPDRTPPDRRGLPGEPCCRPRRPRPQQVRITAAAAADPGRLAKKPGAKACGVDPGGMSRPGSSCNPASALPRSSAARSRWPFGSSPTSLPGLRSRCADRYGWRPQRGARSQAELLVGPALPPARSCRSPPAAARRRAHEPRAIARAMSRINAEAVSLLPTGAHVRAPSAGSIARRSPPRRARMEARFAEREVARGGADGRSSTPGDACAARQRQRKRRRDVAFPEDEAGRERVEQREPAATRARRGTPTWEVAAGAVRRRATVVGEPVARALVAARYSRTSRWDSAVGSRRAPAGSSRDARRQAGLGWVGVSGNARAGLWCSGWRL